MLLLIAYSNLIVGQKRCGRRGAESVARFAERNAPPSTIQDSIVELLYNACRSVDRFIDKSIGGGGPGSDDGGAASNRSITRGQ